MSVQTRVMVLGAEPAAKAVEIQYNGSALPRWTLRLVRSRPPHIVKATGDSLDEALKKIEELVAV